MPAPKSLRLLMNHIPDKYEHLVRCYGYYSNRSRGAKLSRGHPVRRSWQADQAVLLKDL
jgi:hypothetical protein